MMATVSFGGGGSVATVGNVNQMLDGHVVLDLECLDRIYRFSGTFDVSVSAGLRGIDQAESQQVQLRPAIHGPL